MNTSSIMDQPFWVFYKNNEDLNVGYIGLLVNSCHGDSYKNNDGHKKASLSTKEQVIFIKNLNTTTNNFSTLIVACLQL